MSDEKIRLEGCGPDSCTGVIPHTDSVALKVMRAEADLHTDILLDDYSGETRFIVPRIRYQDGEVDADVVGHSFEKIKDARRTIGNG